MNTFFSVRFIRKLIPSLIVVLFCLCSCTAVSPLEERADPGSANPPMAVDTSQDGGPEEEAASSGFPSTADESSVIDRTGEEESEEENAEKSVGKNAEESEEESSRIEDSERGSVLVFASDFQHRDGWKDPPDTLSNILDAIYEADIQPDNILFCGDYSTENGHNNYNASPHQAIEKIKSIVLAHDEEFPIEDMIFEQGNHDELTDDISESGLHEYTDYLVYVLNTEQDYPWRQGKRRLKKEVQQGALNLKECLEELKNQGERRPIFLAGHVPLHFSGRTSRLQGTGDNLYSAELFEIINEEAQSLNLIYLYGHNHSRGWDSYLGGSCVFRSPGDWLLIPRPVGNERVTSKYTQETIYFTYLNAGYVGYFSSAGGEEALTCTVCEIFDDHLQFSRYAEDGLHILSAGGTPNPAKDDRALIPEEYYGSILDSPCSVPLKTEVFTDKKAA